MSRTVIPRLSNTAIPRLRNMSVLRLWNTVIPAKAGIQDWRRNPSYLCLKRLSGSVYDPQARAEA